MVKGEGFVVTAANGTVETIVAGKIQKMPVRATYIYKLQPDV